jgi:hypothetical protein
MSMLGPIGGARRRALRRLSQRDVITTREGWVVDLAGPQRIDAVRVLAPDESREVERALVDALADPLDVVRAEVVLALHGRESAAGAQRCAAAAAGWDHQRYPLSRARAWAYLRDCAGPHDAGPLTGALLLAESAPAVDPVALDALEQALGGDADVRGGVLDHALGVLGDDDPAVVARARQISIRIAARDPAPVAAVLDDDRRAPVAARVLGEIGDLRSTTDLGALLSPARPVAVRAAGAAALGVLGGQRAARILAAHVDDPDPRVRRAATDALAPLAGLLALDEEEQAADGDDLPRGEVGDHVAAEPAERGEMLALGEEPTAWQEAVPALEVDVAGPELREADPWAVESDEAVQPAEAQLLDEALASADESMGDEASPAPELVEDDAPEPVDERAPEPVDDDLPEPESFELQYDATPVALAVDADHAGGAAQADAPDPARNGVAVADITAAAEEMQAVAQAAMAEQAEVETEAAASPDDDPASTGTDGVTEAAGNGHADALDTAAVVERVLADDGEAPWSRSTGPVPAGPPPRPRGAKRSRRRR